MTDMTTSQATVEEAQARAERIRAGLDSLHGTRMDIADAYRAMDWTTLGYDTWESYVGTEFVGAKLRVPRNERRELVSDLRDAGMSTRAIAATTGMSDWTVRQDLTSRDRSSARNLAVGDTPTAEPTQVVGVNGKTYATQTQSEDTAPQRKPAVAELINGDDLAELNGEPVEAEIVDETPAPPPPKKNTPPRKALGVTARSVASDSRSLARRIRNLLGDDRFARNRESVGCGMRAELDDLRRAVDEAQEAIDGPA